MPNSTYIRTPEIKEKIRQSLLKWYRDGHTNYTYGKHLSEETKQKLSKAHLGLHLPEEARKKIGNAHRGTHHSDETKRKISIAKYNLKYSDETRNKFRLANLGKKRSNETRKLISESAKAREAWKNLPSMLGKHLSEETKHRMSKAQRGKPKSIETKLKHKLLWQNPEHRTKQLKAQRQGMKVMPNKPEKVILSILDNKCHKEYKYTGDGSFIIDGLCPDFTNCNGQKKVIELFGDYWHRGQNPQVKIDRYAKFGFGCLVIWENELKDLNKVTDRIKEFNEARINV